VDAALTGLAGLSGAGSAAHRATLLTNLLSRATKAEQDFLIRLLAGELRQGALEGVMVDAVARAADLPGDDVRRALMLSGSLTATATARSRRKTWGGFGSRSADRSGRCGIAGRIAGRRHRRTGRRLR